MTVHTEAALATILSHDEGASGAVQFAFNANDTVTISLGGNHSVTIFVTDLESLFGDCDPR